MLFLVTHQSSGQVPDFSKAYYLYPGDSLNIIHLINNGIKVYKEKIIAWFPKDSLPKKRMNEITDTLNMGVVAAEKFIKAPYSWQVHKKNDPYTFYFRRDT